MRLSIIPNLIYALVIMVSTIPWYLHYTIPEGAANYKIGILNISSHGFYDAQVFTWFISLKLMVIVPMFIWFITYHTWWRYAILSPLILYLFQFWEAFQEGYLIIEAYGNYRVFPLVLLSVFLLFTLSRIVRRHSRSLDTYDRISREIDHLIDKLGEERSGVANYRERYEEILAQLVGKEAADAKLSELKSLQQELQRKLAT
ncbi:hypothetical protein [Lentiprolixibacter aurantiacus]|uniref:Uncharacterized protein n=1 Tax=Lentiprolixibacter aurantiacus TaxID=2993939 RepID=A0AAE3MLD3_9FLAO|nr:hypothetical protein [Lentiprolixibacter aurantiacus]MCX2719533.1 hypothetical protein [Lentiprolixibacter aurantiacus]